MANNIGTHTAKLIEETEQITWAMSGLSRLGIDLGVSHDARDYYNLVEVLAQIQNDRLAALTEYLAKHVIPIVSHLNTPEAA